MPERIVQPLITAYSVANALGPRTRDVAQALAAGRSGLEPCRLDIPFETYCGHFPDVLEPVSPSLAAFDTRLVRMALTVLDGIAAEVAVAARRWGRARVAVVLGTSTGGMTETERALETKQRRGALPKGYDFERQHPFHGLVEAVRHRLGVEGPAYTVSTACSSSGKALASAARLLAAGLADAVVAGGVDTLCQTTVRGFGSLQALSARSCRPFAAARDGTSLGEGGALLLLEREGEGPRLLGVGESSDAHHMSHPHPEGLGARLAMAGALAMAGLTAEDVDYVNAHGTGTPANDAIEAQAIAAVLGERVPVASTKGYTGHLLGAAAATEAVLSLLAIEGQLLPESLGAEPLDPTVKINVCLEPRERRCRVVLSNSFAFGGSNVVVLLGAAA